MAEIVMSSNLRESLNEILKGDDGAVQAQELVQKGAIHALETLQAIGVTEEHAQAMLTSARELGREITAECKRRGLAIVDTNTPAPPGRA